ncbi:MAG: PEPxxWA-CTERM sorting domain-containing protein [Caulobacteraceae bacterium]
MIIKTAAAAAVIALAASGASASIVYTQPFDGTGNLLASQNDTGGGNGHFATVYDNFTLGAAATINKIDWTGGYFNPPTPGPITAFTLTVYADAAGQPGAALYTDTISGNANEAPFACPFACATYSGSANFAAAAGTQYWLSIVPDLAFPPQWGWATGTGGDGVAFQDFFGARTQLPNDLAFTLEGSAPGVPEPAAWAMMLVGFGLAGAALRRRAVTAVA